MKKRFSKILGVALTVVLVASLMVFAIPAAAAPGPTTWGAQTLPGVTGNVLNQGGDVTDMAVASDGTIYAVNDTLTVAAAAVAGTGQYHLYKSTDGGQSFSGIDINAVVAIAAVGAVPLGCVAVSPDDPSALAISTRDITQAGGTTDTVFISNNGGSTWAQLPAIVAATATDAAITDLAVGPARAGTVFGREYLVAVADEAAGVVDGDVQIIGGSAAWASVDKGGGDVNAQYDYMAVAFSPGFLGDRCIAAVGATAVAGTAFQIINTVSGAEIRVPVVLTPTGVAVVTTDYDCSAVVATEIVAADIALPSDWDPSSSAGERSYAGFASAGPDADNGAFRVDAGTPKELGLAGVDIKSVAYNGTIDAGILFAAYATGLTVKRCVNMTSASPTWTTTKKAPTGTNNQVLRLAADYATSETVYVGTGGGAADESAFNVSTDHAVSFDQESLIDGWAGITVKNIDSVVLTPDGGTLFMATDDGADASLWESTTSTSSTSWKRIRREAGAVATIVRLNPAWAANPTIFWVETGAGAGNIWVSANGGDTFATQNVPGAIQDAVAETHKILYAAVGTLVYKSVNSAFFFGTGKNAKAGAIISLAMAPTYPAMPKEGNLLVGGTGACSYSTDGGSTFTKKAGSLAAASTFHIIADEGYADNNTIYCGDSLAAGTANTFRFVIGTDTNWGDLATAAVAATDEVVGLGISNGVLYSVSEGVFGTPRTLYPTAARGTIPWDTANAGLVAPGALGAAGSPNILTVAGNVLYAPDRTAGAPVLWAMNDTMASAKPVITSPAGGAHLPVDSTLGRGILTTVTWDAIGSGSSVVTNYEMRVYSDAEGTAGANTTGNVAVANPLSPSRTVSSQAAADCQSSWMPNTSYTIQVRARGVLAGGGLRSGWSDPVKVTIEAGGVVQAPQAGVQLLGPTGGAADVSLTPGFSWAPIQGATEYEFILATDAGLTSTVGGTPVSVSSPAWQCTTELEAGETYFWAVKATKPTESVQSVGTFTTAAEVVVEEEPSPLLPYAQMLPMFAWLIIAVGAVLAVAVVVLIIRTRRVS